MEEVVGKDGSARESVLLLGRLAAPSTGRRRHPWRSMRGGRAAAQAGENGMEGDREKGDRDLGLSVRAFGVPEEVHGERWITWTVETVS